MWYDELFKELEEKKDSLQGQKMAAYMKDNFPFLGIPKPNLNKIIKPYIKAASKEAAIDWEFIDVCWEKEYREAQYVGVEYIIATEKKLELRDLQKLKKIIITKSWWDICDSIDGVIGNLSLKYAEINDEMLNWSKSDNLWLRRVAIDYQQRFKEKTNTNLLEKIICNNFGSDEFFINKAIGWSLREYSKTDADWVRRFILKYEKQLSKLSKKEGSKYL